MVRAPVLLVLLVLLVLPHSCCLKLHYLNQPAGGAKQNLGEIFSAVGRPGCSTLAVLALLAFQFARIQAGAS